jgi:ferritin-like metal-binding protein YciE
MKLMSANIQDLRSLYVESLQKALDMEQKITKALPEMIDKTSDSELSSALREHLEQTRGHVTKVENLLRNASGDTDTVTCKVINSLTTEASDMVKDAKDAAIRDISIIAACQEVEHHEMAIYGTLRTWAQIIGNTNDASVLQSILNEEEQADKILTQVASRVNYQAAA